MRSVGVPGGFADFDVREDAADAARAKVHAKTVRDALDNKLLKEAQNAAAFASWKRAADAAKPDVMAASRRHPTRATSTCTSRPPDDDRWSATVPPGATD